MKKILLAILIIVLIIAGGLTYWLLFAPDKSEATAELKDQIVKMTDDIIAEIDEAGQVSVNDEEKSQDENQDTSLEDEGNTSDEKENTDQSNSKSSVTTNKKEATLKATYDNAFYRLQSEGNGIINGLLASATSDYKALKAAGQAGTTDLANLASSYVKRANAMEKQMDSSVNAVLAKMKGDMSAAGVPEPNISQYVSSFQSQYNAEKEARRSQVLSKAKGYI